MAQKTIVTMLSDLSETEETEDNPVITEEFGLDGVTYEIDVLATEKAALRDALAPYVAAARKTGRIRGGGRQTARTASSPTRAAQSTSTYDRETSQKIREWAKAHGMEVSERGRIPKDITEAWEKRDTLTRTPQRPPEKGAPETLTLVPDAEEPESEATEKVGRDGLTRTRREEIRAIATEQGMDVKKTGNIKKDVIDSVTAWENSRVTANA